MDGRWRLWLVGGLVASTVGCQGFGNRNKFPDSSRQTSRTSSQEEPNIKGPLKPETTLAFGLAVLDAADPKFPRSNQERERLLGEAQNNFKTVLDKQPKNTEALAGMAKTYYYLGDQNQAVNYYRQALDIDSRNARLWFELASVQSKLMRDFSAASQSLTQASRIDPDNIVYRRWLGRTLSLSGRVEEGVALLKQNQPEAEVRFEVAEMLHIIGRDDLSKQQLEMALRIDPNFSLAREVLVEFGTPFANREIQPARYEIPITLTQPTPTPPPAPPVVRPVAAVIRPAEPLPLNMQR